MLAVGIPRVGEPLRGPDVDVLARRRLVGSAGGLRRSRRRRRAPPRRAARDDRRARRLRDDARLPRVRRGRRAARAVPHVAQHEHRAARQPSCRELFGTNIPLRWSIAHLYQAVSTTSRTSPHVRFLTTLAGYVHWQLTGRRVLGVGDASGMFPIDPATTTTTPSWSRRFDGLVAQPGAGSGPHRAAARGARRRPTRRGADRRTVPPSSTRPERCVPASRCAHRRAMPARAWSRRTRSPRAPAT